MRAEPFTLLSLFDYAKIVGLDPLHFAGGYSALRPAPTCRDIWYQYDWQDVDLVSRHQLARLISEAEQDIADALGYWPAPVWIEDERQRFTQLYRRDLTGFGQDLRFRNRHMRTKWGYVIEGGQRATELIDVDAVPVFTDPDGDAYTEIATFTVPNVSATLDPCEVHMYYRVYDPLVDDTRTDPSSTGADPAWEIRPIKCSLSGTTLTVRCNKWQLFRPQLYEELAPDPIDADAAASYVDSVSLYRVYNDPATQVSFGWGYDATCAVTDPQNFSTQVGCLRIDDNRNGLVVPVPATYNATTGTFTAASRWTNTYEPDIVRLWYRAGYTDAHASCQVLSTYWATTIAMLATARSDWPICTCNNQSNNILLSNQWRENLRRGQPDQFWNADAKTLNNPFGPRMGEVEAWARVAKARGRAKGQAVIT